MAQVDFSLPPPGMGDHFQSNNINITPNNAFQKYQPQPPQQNKFRPFQPKHNNQLLNSLPDDFDGKRLRKSNMRKTVDYNCAIARALQNRVWQRDYRDRHALQPDCLYIPDLVPPQYYPENPTNAVTTRFVKTATNKMRCPIFCMAWTPEGRRLVTGASSGEFTLWNGLTFNFETILQAHDSPVRSMMWSHNDGWMITGDHSGYCKYWQSNMNNVKMFQAHKEAIRGLSFSPTDQKILSCSDDGTLRIWDFATTVEERVLRGHGSDVKCCGWHPYLGLIASGSKDNQQPIKLWDPKTGDSLTTLHAHKSTVMDLKWNKNGNWFITASRDHFLKLFDIRYLSQPVQTFRGHKKEASCIAWHPYHEGLLASGGSDGAILFWHVGADKEVGSIDAAHDSIVWALDWHPMGHILCSGSNDHTTKFWTRNRPGDKMRDKYNLNLGTGLIGDDAELGEMSTIPGMAPEDRIDSEMSLFSFREEVGEAMIPGLEGPDLSVLKAKEKLVMKKQPYAKPIPKNFMASWNETSMNDDEEEEALEGYGTESVLEPLHNIVNQLMETVPGVKKLESLEPKGVIAFGKVIPIKANSKLYRKVLQGQDALLKYMTSGKVDEFKELPGFKELEMLYESGSESSTDENSDVGRLPTPNELNVARLDLDEFMKPFTGFVEADLDDVPYRDREARSDAPNVRDGKDDETSSQTEQQQITSTPQSTERSTRVSRWDSDNRDEEARDVEKSHEKEQQNQNAEANRPPSSDYQSNSNKNNMPPGPGGFMGPHMGPMGMGPMGPMGFMGPNMMNNYGPNFGPMGNFGPIGGPGPMGMGNMGGPGPNMSGPNMRGPGPNMGGPNMGGPGPNMGGPNMGGPGPNMGGPNMGGHNMGGPGPNMGGPNMGGPGPNMGGPNMGGPGPNMGGHNMGGPGPNMVGPNMGGPGPNMGGPNMGGPGPNMGGPNMGGPGRNMGGPNMGGPGSNMGGPNMGGPGPNMGGPNMGGPGPNMGGPNMGGPGPNMGGHNMGGPGPNMGPNMGGPNMGGPGHNMGPNMMGPGPNMGRGPNMNQHMGSPNMGGPGPRMGGPGMNMGGPGNFGPGGPNMGPGNFQGPGPRNGNFGGPNRRNDDDVDERWRGDNRKRRFDDEESLDDDFEDDDSWRRNDGRRDRNFHRGDRGRDGGARRPGRGNWRGGRGRFN